MSKVDLTSIDSLNRELTDAIVNFTSHHSRMREMRAYYEKSAFFAPKAGEPSLAEKQRRKNNYLKIFADKNIEYTSQLPTVKVPTPGADEAARLAASQREKIILSTYQHCNVAMLQRKWAFDATVMSAAIAETSFNLKTRRVYVKRHDPRYVVWQISNDGENRVIAFWAVWSVTKEECAERWGVYPTRDPISSELSDTQLLRNSDGKDWYTMAIRWDGETRSAWVGDVSIEEPHKHMMGVIPVDICQPFDNNDPGNRGAFYLENLIPYQAELNDIVLRRSMVVRRMSSPVVWGRGLSAGQSIDDIKRNFQEQGGGFVGLKQNGDMGILQVNETKIFQEAKEDVLSDMTRQAGFSAAAFGETVGANTSGDALGMYFSPIELHIAHQMIAWKSFWQSINAKILRAYDLFGLSGEQFPMAGYAPGSTLLTITDEKTNQVDSMISRGGFAEKFDRTVIAGQYFNLCTPITVTPKNKLEEMRMAMDGVTTGFFSRTTGYETWGIADPEAELALLRAEQGDPLLNPEGTSQILQAVNQNQQPGVGGAGRPALPPGTPAPPADPARASLSGEAR